MKRLHVYPFYQEARDEFERIKSQLFEVVKVRVQPRLQIIGPRDDEYNFISEASMGGMRGCRFDEVVLHRCSGDGTMEIAAALVASNGGKVIRV